MLQPTSRSRSLAFMACPPEDFARLLGELQRIDANTDWCLIAFYPPPCDLPHNMTVTVSGRSARVAIGLLAVALIHSVHPSVTCTSTARHIPRYTH